MNLVYKNEKTLFTLLALFSLLVWIPLFIFVLPYALLLGLVYLFAQSGFIAYIRGTGVAVNQNQFPELYAAYRECADKLGVKDLPEFYILNSDGFLNALATRFLRRHYVVLFSSILDALEDHPESIKFYIGHELGHIQRGHLGWKHLFILPGSLLPLAGPAYRRAQEYSCDLHGVACCNNEQDIQNAIAVLAAGSTRWKALSNDAYLQQANETGKFWMSFHELTGSYPWLVKRMKHALAAKRGQNAEFPSRHPFAWVLAALLPNTGVGGAAAGSMLVMMVFVGIMVGVGIPAIKAYEQRAAMLQGAMDGAGDAGAVDDQGNYDGTEYESVDNDEDTSSLENTGEQAADESVDPAGNETDQQEGIEAAEEESQSQ